MKTPLTLAALATGMVIGMSLTGCSSSDAYAQGGIEEEDIYSHIVTDPRTGKTCTMWVYDADGTTGANMVVVC